MEREREGGGVIKKKTCRDREAKKRSMRVKKSGENGKNSDREEKKMKGTGEKERG